MVQLRVEDEAGVRVPRQGLLPGPIVPKGHLPVPAALKHQHRQPVRQVQGRGINPFQVAQILGAHAKDAVAGVCGRLVVQA